MTKLLSLISLCIVLSVIENGIATTKRELEDIPIRSSHQLLDHENKKILSTPDSTNAALSDIVPVPLLVNYGIILFPAFDAIDVFGPLGPLNLLSLDHHMKLSLISTNLSAVSTRPRAAAMNRANSTFGESILPTHTFATAPKDLDVLFVPGGLDTRSPIDGWPGQGRSNCHSRVKFDSTSQCAHEVSVLGGLP